MLIIVSCAQGARSLASEYSVKEDAVIYIHPCSSSVYDIVKDQRPAIKSLLGKRIRDIHIVSPQENAPGASAIYVVSAEISVYLDLSGKIDVNAEISRLEQKLSKAQAAASKQADLVQREGFKESASEAVFAAELGKLDETRTAIQNYQTTIQQFEKMKI